jgi:hypothetical protein
MKLVNTTAQLKDIYLDPYNPRFLNQENVSQAFLIQKIFRTRDAKELLASMTLNVKWVNKIVVVGKVDFTEKQKRISEIENAEYLVIEGNNRLACLKSGKIVNYIPTTEIPLILAQKESEETEAEFQAQLRITQGIANVMVVKEWSVISKARHLYLMYKDLVARNIDGGQRPLEIYRRISQELGISVTEVRESVIRYAFFKTIEEISDSIPEEHWGYLEAFDRTKEIREKFGMSPDKNLFDLESDQENMVEEILKDIPSLIKKAANEGINSKQFRDIIGKVFNEIDDHEEVFEKVNEILKQDSDFSFRAHLDVREAVTEDVKWLRNLESIEGTLGSFPPFAPWSAGLKPRLEEIQRIVDQHINAMP